MNLHKNTPTTNIIKKRLAVDTLLKFNESKKDDTKITLNTFSMDYSIYGTNSDLEECQKRNFFSLPDFDILVYTVKGLDGMLALLNEKIASATFFGAIALIGESKIKIPYNILSYTFIRRLEAGVVTLQDDVKIAVYSYKNKLDENIIKDTENKLLNLDIKDIVLEANTKEDKPSLLLKAPKEWEDAGNGIHLSDLHIQLDADDINTKNLLRLDPILLENAEMTYENLAVKKLLHSGDWMVEMGCIDARGIVVPSYGFYKHMADGSMIDLLAATKHPNISSDGSNYCTGVNGKNTIKGVSELSYGNLSSPMNTNIWHKDSFSIVKGFQKVFWEMLLNTEIK